MKAAGDKHAFYSYMYLFMHYSQRYYEYSIFYFSIIYGYIDIVGKELVTFGTWKQYYQECSMMKSYTCLPAKLRQRQRSNIKSESMKRKLAIIACNLICDLLHFTKFLLFMLSECLCFTCILLKVFILIQFLWFFLPILCIFQINKGRYLQSMLIACINLKLLVMKLYYMLNITLYYCSNPEMLILQLYTVQLHPLFDIALSIVYWFTKSYNFCEKAFHLYLYLYCLSVQQLWYTHRMMTYTNDIFLLFYFSYFHCFVWDTKNYIESDHTIFDKISVSLLIAHWTSLQLANCFHLFGMFSVRLLEKFLIIFINYYFFIIILCFVFIL